MVFTFDWLLKRIAAPNEAAIFGVFSDSRAVVACSVFVAVPCADVQKHIAEAVVNGACIVVQEQDTICQHVDPVVGAVGQLGLGSPVVVYVKCARKALAQLCGVFYKDRPGVLSAVTGTNGKSSTVSFISQIQVLLGIKSADVGTLGVHVSDQSHEPRNAAPFALKTKVPDMTTFDAVTFHSILSELHANGVRSAAIEATSHGLHQYRLDGVQFDAVALTNITQDHLDYHKTMEEYTLAKVRLFADLAKPSASAILNKKSSFLQFFEEICQKRGLKTIFYALNEGTDIYAENIRPSSQSAIHSDAKIKSQDPADSSQPGVVFDLHIFGGCFPNVCFNPLGSFQIENLLCALGLVIACNPQIKIHDVVATIPYLRGIPGRLELATYYNHGSIFIDFAHTPDALQTVLSELKQLHPTRLIVVFGCGGERDQGKRKEMGRIASALATKVIITDDNPRGEDPAKIRKDILEGAPGATEIAGRGDAIRYAIANTNKGDILLVAGRGHEVVQKLDGVCVPFSDRSFVEDVVRNFG
ncbi:MAG: UDP-N-acetylmuramoyl-L-alanyl-D-glutamate--2,6-diaminopimelate ligase [Holosporales bacterium]|nr:UDP-N-acetylmuramoyl-L-alanyl-D-glutamate--2,6-diaminopimelate ligase [Holosporales bacterium]